MKRVEIDGPDERVVDALIEAGLCKDANEVVHVSLTMLGEMREERIRLLKEGIETAVREAEAGNIITPKSVAETKARYRARLASESEHE